MEKEEGRRGGGKKGRGRDGEENVLASGPEIYFEDREIGTNWMTYHLNYP